MKLEVEESSKHNEEIAEKWKVVLDCAVPQEMATQMAEQKKVSHQLLIHTDRQL